MVLGDLRIDKLMAQCFKAFEGTFLIRPHQPRIPRHVGGEDRSEPAGLAHPSQPALRRPSSIWAWSSGRIHGTRFLTYMSKEAGVIAIALVKASFASSMRPSAPRDAASHRYGFGISG